MPKPIANFSRREAIDYLHSNKGYSRRISAKLVDLALDKHFDSVMAEALRKGLEGGLKKKEKIKHYILLKR
jgi:hypothetical protein